VEFENTIQIFRLHFKTTNGFTKAGCAINSVVHEEKLTDPSTTWVLRNRQLDLSLKLNIF